MGKVIKRTKITKSFGRRIQAPYYLVVLIGFVGFAIVPDQYLWLWVGTFVLGVAGAIIFALNGMKKFVCPDCGTTISSYIDTEGKPDAPIQYFCQSCDVVWDTNLRTLDE